MSETKIAPVHPDDAGDIAACLDELYTLILCDADPEGVGAATSDIGSDHFVRVKNKEYGTAFSVFVRESRAKQFFGKRKKNVDTMIEVLKLVSSGMRARCLFHYHIVDDDKFEDIRHESA